VKKIIIIGGGLSGCLLTINLLRYATTKERVGVSLIDRNPENNLGSAYSSYDECLLLNVPACRMGAFSSDPKHFLAWALDKGVPVNGWDFLPRKLYKYYIQELLRHALHEKNASITLDRIHGEAVDILIRDGQAEVFMHDDKSFLADHVVLALGNFPPRDPSINNRGFIKSKYYFQNPWTSEPFVSLSQNDPVFLIGTGQTMVDMIMSLNKRRHKGKIIALSRHGYLPVAHTTYETYPSFYKEIKNLVDITEIFRVIMKHFDKADKMECEKNAVIDSLRPKTQEIWMQLPINEKERFLRHLFRYWEIIRSRIPQESEAIVKQMLSSGQLTIIAGRIKDIAPKEKSVDIYYSSRGDSLLKMETTNLLINCIGPEMDYNKIDHPLIKNMLDHGIIQPDSLKLGINALPNGAIIHKDGTVSDVFYTLGSPLRGILWEVIAVPEIRLQAEQLARKLINTPHKQKDTLRKN
jgi:uncharacterized NAD(P)/FAD-binding protein YdhS